MLIYRLGNCVPVPYVNVVALNNYFTQQLANTVLGLYNAMSGSAFSQATVFALGIQPYINASIIIELLTIAIPALERLAKEDGEEGRKKIQNITRYTTIGLGEMCIRDSSGRGKEAAAGKRRLHQDYVVRRSCVRAEDEGRGRHVLSLHAASPGASG